MAKRKTRTGLQAAIHAVTEPLRDAKRAARIAVAAVRRRLNKRTTFIGITGSHGKSTAAALLAAILGETAPTKLGILFNDSRSAARTVRSTSPRRDRYCVQEISGAPRGNLDKALRVLRPQVGIVTAIGGDHRVEFRSFAEAAAEKSKLIRHLGPDGLAILNRDDPFVAEMAKDCACRIAWYGRDESATLRLISATSDWPDRLTLEVAYRGEPFVVKTRLVGTHWHISVLAALLTALELGISRETCLAAIAAYEPLFNKMSVHPAPQGAWYVLDGTKLTYHGMEACLSFLKDARAPRRSVLLGTISDHPGKDRPHYEKVARLALDAADRVIFTGKNAMRPRRLKEEFHDRLMMIEDRQEAAALFSRDLLPGEIVYIKGPLGDRLARLFQVER